MFSYHFSFRRTSIANQKDGKRKIKNNKTSKFTFFAEDLCKNGIFESKNIHVQLFFSKKITSKLYKKTSKTKKWKKNEENNKDCVFC